MMRNPNHSLHPNYHATLNRESLGRRRTDEWFRVLVETMDEGLGISDEYGVITYINPKLGEITGYTAEEMIGRPAVEMFTGVERSLVQQRLDEIKLGKSAPFEIAFTTKYGRERILYISPRPLVDAKGRFAGSFGVVTDITDRKRAEDKVLTLSAAMEQCPVGVIITDRNADIEYSNRRFSELTGYTADELRGKNPRLLKSGHTSAETYENLFHALGNGLEWRGEIQDRKKNGELYWVYEIVSCIRNPQGEVTHYLGLQEDISARKQAEAALRESERTYSLLAESSLTGIYVVQDGRLVYANPRLADILGYVQTELIHADVMTLIFPDDRPQVAELITNRLASDAPGESYHVRGMTKNGTPVSLKKSCVRIEFQGRPAILGNVVDITQEKQMERKLLASTKQLRNLSKQLLTIQEQERKYVASELHDSVGQYLNTALFGLQQLTARHSQSGELPSNVTASISNLISLLQEAIQEVRRLSTDLRPPTLDDLGIVATVNWFCRKFQSIYPGIAIEQHIDIEEDEIPESLKIVLFRILQEALNNVAKHAKARQTRVALALSDAQIEFRIEDDGRGFDVAKTFAAAWLDRGIGLVGMRERVRLSGGGFSIESEPGRGTRICARWPLNLEDAAAGRE
jgi:PAS domain S-box-containing protein